MTSFNEQTSLGSTLSSSPKDSFYNRMRLEVAQLMDQVDFGLLDKSALVRSKTTAHTGKKFQLSTVDDFLKATVKEKPIRTKPSGSQTLRTPSKSGSIDSSGRTPFIFIRPQGSSKPAGSRQLKSDDRSEPPRTKVLTRPQTTLNKSWIRVDDIYEIPEGLPFVNA